MQRAVAPARQSTSISYEALVSRMRLSVRGYYRCVVAHPAHTLGAPRVHASTEYLLACAHAGTLLLVCARERQRTGIKQEATTYTAARR